MSTSSILPGSPSFVLFLGDSPTEYSEHPAGNETWSEILNNMVYVSFTALQALSYLNIADKQII